MDKNEVRIFLYDMENADTDKLIQKYGDTFDCVRAKTVTGAKSAKHVKETVCAGALLAAVTVPYGKDPREIEYRMRGKPYFKDTDDLFFNISHSGRYAAVALSGQDIGMDLQKQPAYRAALAGHILTESERETLEDGDAAGLNRFWVMKESYVKYTGLGLMTDFKDISFLKEDNGLCEVIHEGMKDAHIKQAYAPEGYAMCVCAKDIFDITKVTFIKL